MEKDPVCGMDVDPKDPAGTSEYTGKTYYFCSSGCKRAFDQDPGNFVGEHSEHGHVEHGEHQGHRHNM